MTGKSRALKKGALGLFKKLNVDKFFRKTARRTDDLAPDSARNKAVRDAMDTGTRHDLKYAKEKLFSRELGDLFKNGRTPTRAELDQLAKKQGWTLRQTPNGPPKYVDENGVVRMTVKSGSGRAPGSADPHVELRNPDGQRIDPHGNPVNRKDLGNHTPIHW